MQLSGTTLGFIVIGVVLFVSFTLGILALWLRKRQVERSSRVMITMSGTTVVHGNGSRRFEDAVWIPSLVGPKHAALNPLNNHRISGSFDGPMNLYLPEPINANNNGTIDLEKGIYKQMMANKRASYMSAKKLEIPDVLTEDDEERVSSEGEGRSSPSTSASATSMGTSEEKLPVIYIENTEASHSRSSGFELDVDIQKFLTTEKQISTMSIKEGAPADSITTETPTTLIKEKETPSET
ncbi:hypothetical protein AA313_de0209410 [Arthrobotrys entomopaga]|nr:hypothetical protein AA313_de0209410 [Arthrobotrys entomopaga]